MKSRIAAVFFDMGSTLSHQDPTRERVLTDFLVEQGYQRSLQDVRRALLQADIWWHLWAQKTPPEKRTEEMRQEMRLQYRRLFLESLNLTSDDGLREALGDVWRSSIMRRHNAIFPDVLPTLEALRARGLRLAIVSNWDDSLNSHCDDLGLTPRVDTIVGSQYVGYEKPDPRIFQIALDRLGLRPEQAIHVGDMYPSDVVGARRAGIVPVLLDRYDLQPNVDCLRVRTLDQILDLLEKASTT